MFKGSAAAAAKRLLVAAVVAVVWAAALLPSVAGQGLNIGVEQLGAGEAAVVDQFSRFEDVLELYSQSTGGRGRGGRGSGSSKTGGTGFKDVESLQQLRNNIYYLAGSPTVYSSWNTSQNPGGISLLPGVRDQLSCDSCVTQAIAAAIQAAAGAAWRQNADQAEFNISAASLYYCSEGGKTCKTGWDLQEALAQIMDKSQFLIRPTECAGKAAKGMLDNPANEPQVNDWKPACQEAEQACRGVSSRAQPWLSCSYKSLSSFVDIQRHIRQHGAVLTRITIYDNFWKHYNITSELGMPKAIVAGAKHPAYNRTSDSDSTSKPLFGHAAVIVGYNNTELTWTLLNSYGTQRFTLDGLFKIAMGVAGVAVPDQTFGIECKPAPGGPDDLHFTDWLTPWINNTQLKPRKPVDYWDRDKEWNNLNASCYRYNMTAGDTMSSIADAFGVSLQQLVRDNQALFPLQQVNYTLKTGTQLKELQTVAAVANLLRLDKGIKPFFVCRTRKEGQTWPGKVICQQSDLAPCAGSWGPCKIVYSEADVSVSLAVGTAIKVCGISKVDELGAFDRVAYLKEPRDSQPRALRALQEVLGDVRRQITQDGSEGACYGLGVSTMAARYPLYAECDASGNIKLLDLNYWRIDVYDPSFIPPFNFNDGRTSVALMNLQQLSILFVGIDSGSLAAQLGALRLARLEIADYCFPDRFTGHGTLPGNWLVAGSGWRETMTDLMIGAKWFNLYEAAAGRCGVAGSLPAKWFEGNQSSALRRLNMSTNAITGGLPENLPKVMSSLETLDVEWNQIEGSIPTSFSTLENLALLNLANLKLSGAVPVGLSPRYIYLNSNRELSGCVPFNPDRQPGDATYFNTGITGLCEADPESRWGWQRESLRFELMAVLGSNISLVQGTLGRVLDNLEYGLPQTVHDFFSKRPNAAAEPRTKYNYGQTGRLNDNSSTLHILPVLQLFNGMPNILRIQVVFREDGECSPVNMQPLPDLLWQLPHLEVFNITKDCPGMPSQLYQLPSGLLGAAPLLKVLVLSSVGLVGTIPDWQSWTTLQQLNLRGNQLNGSLPEWMGRLSALVVLDLSGNKISGSLPAAWGDVMPATINMNLSSNPGIGGSIPPSWWQRFSRATAIDLRGTSLTGCRPESWPTSTRWPASLAEAPFCGDSEAASLAQVQKLLYKALNISGASDPLDCRSRRWLLTCNGDGQVVGINFAGDPDPVVEPVSMTAMLKALMGLTQLQNLTLANNPQLFKGSKLPASGMWSSWPQLRHLDLSNCGLLGRLPEQLGNLPALSHLDVNNNPGIIGPLPRMLAATQLQFMDVFDCGLSGPLPVLYAALPLQVLRVGSSGQSAGPNSSISGPLPAEYGMLKRLRELHIVNSLVTGSIPPVWFDPSAAQAATTTAAAQAVLAEVQAAAAEAAAAAHSAEASLQGATAVAATAEPAVSSPELFQQAQLHAAAAARIATAWQRAVQELESSSRSGNAGAAAAQTPAGGGLSMQQLETLVLYGNAALEGTLPPQLSSVDSLRVLDLSGSKLSGSLPASWGQLSQLQVLYLSGNQLSGSIPAFWLGMRSLQLLDLSSNPSLGGAFSKELYALARQQLACLRLFNTGTAGAGNEWAPDSLAAIKQRFARDDKHVIVAVSQGEAGEGACSQFD